MKPEEKAKEIYKWIKDSVPFPDYYTEEQYKNHLKFTAIEHADKIINVLEHFCYNGIMFDSFENGKITVSEDELPEEYWIKVKSELNKL